MRRVDILLWTVTVAAAIALVVPEWSAADAPQPVRPPPIAAAPAPARTAAPAPLDFAAETVERSPDGHFYVDAQVNGAHVRFMVDTGATVVALTGKDAQRAGIALGPERSVLQSAGGLIEVIPVTIDRIAIGPLEAGPVRAAVVDDLPVSLLGQTFLSEIGSVEIRGDEMRAALTQDPTSPPCGGSARRHCTARRRPPDG